METFLIVGGIFLAVGLLVVYFGFRERGILVELRTVGQEVQATVLAVDRKVTRDSDGDTDTDWVASYQFVGMDGQTYSGSKRYETPRNLPSVGSSLLVIYNPDKPERNRLSQDVQSNMGPLVILGVGLLFAVLGMGMVVAGLAGLVS